MFRRKQFFELIPDVAVEMDDGVPMIPCQARVIYHETKRFPFDMFFGVGE